MTVTCCACYACWQHLHHGAYALLLHAETNLVITVPEWETLQALAW